MNDTRDENQRYQHWVDTVNEAWKHGWRHRAGWVFESPSGTLHDLSAANLALLGRIEAAAKEKEG